MNKKFAGYVREIDNKFISEQDYSEDEITSFNESIQLMTEIIDTSHDIESIKMSRGSISVANYQHFEKVAVSYNDLKDDKVFIKALKQCIFQLFPNEM